MIIQAAASANPVAHAKPTSLARLTGSRFSGVLLLLAICIAWDISARTRIIDLVSWPPFFDVAARWLDLLFNGETFQSLGPSLRRAAFGYTFATLVAVTAGVLIGYSRVAYNLLEPTLEVLRPISVIALIPVIILFLGLGDTMKVFIIAYACFFPVLLNTITGVRDVDPVLIDSGRTFKLSRWRTVRYIVLPAATPFIFTGMRISVGFSLMAMVAAEMLTGGDGIGAFILDAQRTFRIVDMYAGIITLGALGYIANRTFIAAERWLLRWQFDAAAKTNE